MINFKSQTRKGTYIISILIILSLFLIILFSSLITIYEKRSKILLTLGFDIVDHDEKRFL